MGDTSAPRWLGLDGLKGVGAREGAEYVCKGKVSDTRCDMHMTWDIMHLPLE